METYSTERPYATQRPAYLRLRWQGKSTAFLQDVVEEGWRITLDMESDEGETARLSAYHYAGFVRNDRHRHNLKWTVDYTEGEADYLCNRPVTLTGYAPEAPGRPREDILFPEGMVEVGLITPGQRRIETAQSLGRLSGLTVTTLEAGQPVDWPIWPR